MRSVYDHGRLLEAVEAPLPQGIGDLHMDIWKGVGLMKKHPNGQTNMYSHDRYSNNSNSRCHLGL